MCFKPNDSHRIFLTILAWMVILVISDLPNILWDTFFGLTPDWLLWGKAGFLALFLATCLAWKNLQPLWQFACVMFLFYLALGLNTWVGNTTWWQIRFVGEQTSFARGYLELHVRDLGVAFVVIGVLWLVKRRREAFYLTKGKLDARIEPVRWLGIREGESWSAFGLIFAFAAGLLILVVVILAAPPSWEMVMRAIPLLPIAVLLAALNAFSEEIYYRASLFSTLQETIGRKQTQFINVVFFGLAHVLVGSPPGVIGFLLTGFLAWLMGKSILETKGLFWAWFIHFVPDVVIFASYALWWA